MDFGGEIPSTFSWTVSVDSWDDHHTLKHRLSSLSLAGIECLLSFDFCRLFWTNGRTIESPTIDLTHFFCPCCCCLNSLLTIHYIAAIADGSCSNARPFRHQDHRLWGNQIFDIALAEVVVDNHSVVGNNRHAKDIVDVLRSRNSRGETWNTAH